MSRRRLSARTAVPLTIVALIVVGPLVVALTETPVERDLKETLGYRTGCEPMTDENSRWRAGPQLPKPRDEPRAVVVDGQVYLIGGVVGLNQLGGGRVEAEEIGLVTRFDPARGSYQRLTPMPEPGNHIGVAVHDGAIYVIGGLDPQLDRVAKRRFSRYIVAEDRWEQLPPVPTPRGAMAIGVLGNQLIVAGGVSGEQILKTVEAYDLSTERWTRRADMPTARQHVGAAVVDGALYVLGGRDHRSDSLARADRYDPVADRWERLPDLPVAVGGLDAVSAQGSAIAIGGGNDRGGTVSDAVQRFDPGVGRWELLPQLRTARHGHAAAHVGNRLWVFGGSPCAYYAASDLVEWLPLALTGGQPVRAGSTS